MDKTLEFRDISGFYTDEGKGKTILLLHGFCEDGYVWDDFRKNLRGDFRVVVPDLPGYRKSTMSKMELTVEWMADFVYSILEKEKIKNPFIIGHSMGGYITLAFAEKYTGMCERIGLFHSHCFADDTEKKASRQKAIEFITKSGTDGFVEELYNNLFGKKFNTESKATVDKLKAYAKMYPAATVIAGLRAMINRPNREHVLKSVKHSVMFILGKQDKAIPYSKSLEQCAFPEISDVHILENSGHMGMIEEPKKTLEMVREFANLKVTKTDVF